tara:strand:- start:494 stop:715 length:222 start_codon:yes stop_codon:yes gene_type:complete
MYCAICNDIVFDKYYLLPTDEIKINNIYQISKKVDNIEFIYNILCEKCLDVYIKNYPFNFNNIMKREIYGKYL